MSATGWKKFAALPPVPPLCADGQVAGDVMLENTSTHHIVSLMLGRDHVDIAPVAPQEIVDQAVLEVRALRHKPKLEDISFTLRRGEVLGIAGLLGGRGAVNC